VRWLSRGAVLKGFFHLRSEIDIFMTEKGKTVPQLSDDKWIIELAFLVDITCLNEFTLNLIEKVNHCLTCFLLKPEMKLKLLHKHINEQNLDHFPFLQSCF
jgi:hypothetical protein